VAWNVVTSYGDTSAKAMGMTKITPHDQRYEEAHEYMDLMYVEILRLRSCELSTCLGGEHSLIGDETPSEHA